MATPREKRSGSVEPIAEILLLTEATRTYARDLVRGVAKYARLQERWIFCREAQWLEKRKLGNSQSIDGVIAIAEDPKAAQRVLSLDLPTVMCVDAPGLLELTDISLILAADADIGRMGAQYLQSLELQHFAFCGVAHRYWSEGRRDGFRGTMAGHGHPVHELMVGQRWTTSRHHTIERLADWLTSLPKPIGVMACNDEFAELLLTAAKMAELPVPDSVAVLGVDNDDLVCELTDPPLSSIALNTTRAGYEAAAVLKSLIDSGCHSKNDVFIRPISVAVRQSTDIISAPDRAVVDAIRFIRNNAKRLIDVSDVCDAVALQRRQLERRFRQVVNRSINQEIRRARVEAAAQLLQETNLTISQIVDALEFSNLHHLGRIFTKVKGVTPVEYRRRYGNI